jgi:hypothetical protein
VPEIPFAVTLYFPALVVLMVESVNVADCALTPFIPTIAGEMEQVEFFGAPEQLIVIVSLKPFSGVSVKVELTEFPGATESEEGDAVMEKSGPVPESATFCGLFHAPSVKRRLAERLPIPDGVNVTPTAHFPLGASVAVHLLLLIAKSPASAPVMDKVGGAMEAPPGGVELVKVADLGALVLPIASAAKLSVAGAADAAGVRLRRTFAM